MKKLIVTLFVLSFAMGCSSSKKLVTKTTESEKVVSTNPDLELADVQQGKVLYAQKCISCHLMKSPMMKTPEQWPGVVSNMVKMANKKEMKINPQEEALILKYLVAVTSPSKSK